MYRDRLEGGNEVRNSNDLLIGYLFILLYFIKLKMGSNGWCFAT